MEQFGMLLSSLFIPIGLSLFFIGATEKNWGMEIAAAGLVVLGFMALLYTLHLIQEKTKRDDARFQAQIQELHNNRVDVTSAIKALIEEIRQDRDERKANINTNKPDNL
jgi:cytochrome c biogenesis protein CcdA